MPVCLSIYTAAGPSIHPTIYILARGPFALCQAILIPIYHLFLRRFFFSISLFFLNASFFFKPFDSNWFLSGPLIRMPLSSFLYSSSSSSSSSLSASLSGSFFPSSFHSILRRYADANLFSRVVSFSPTHFFISGYLGGREFAKERRTTMSEKGATETLDWTKHLHALLHIRRECSRSDSVENRSLESPVIPILLFSTITP